MRPRCEAPGGKRIRELRSQRRACLSSGLLLIASCALACAGGAKSSSPELLPARGEPLDFAFGALDGSVVTGEATRGRVTALLFAATYDLTSQLAARRMDEALRAHVPRFNAACVAMEVPENAPLVQIFRDTLELSYRVAIADREELRDGPFGDIDRVPTLVLLDRRGRERLRVFGPFTRQQLEEWLHALER